MTTTPVLPLMQRCHRNYRQCSDDEEESPKLVTLERRRKKKNEEDWGSARLKILTEIVKRLQTMESFECFGSICRSWRVAASACYTLEFPHRKTTLEGPWLMLPGEAETETEQCFVISRRILSGGTITRKLLVDLPQGVISKTLNSKQCIISCKDWLLVVSGSGDDNDGGGDVAILVHPLSRVQIHLPDLVTLDTQQITRHQIIHKFVLSADPFSTPDNDFFVAVIWGNSNRLGFCKPRDTSWTVAGDHFVRELIYNHHDNKLYALSRDRLIVCDIHGPNPTELLSLHTLPPARLYFQLEADTEVDKRYLIEWEKNTFLVVDHHVASEVKIGDEVIDGFTTIAFVVREINVEDGKCLSVKHLRDRSLFVGRNSSFHVDCSREVHKHIKPNCIYFAGDIYSMIPSAVEEIGIYSVADERILYLSSFDNNTDVIMGTESPHIWFGPSF